MSDIRFMRGHGNLVRDRRLKLLACCIVEQQRAGFGDVVDLRQWPCPACKAPGFNTGWGFFAHTCGAEVLSDGEWSTSCPKERRP